MEDAFPELSKDPGPLLTHRCRFYLWPYLWGHADLREFAAKAQSIQPIKYFIRDDSGKFILNPLIDSNVSANQGGIYMFCIKPPHVSDYAGYLMYIGRAQKTDNQNLRKRVKEYQSSTRPRIDKMIKLWKDFLYVKCIPILDNDAIVSLEKDLINSFLPPCNSEIPNVELKNAIAAFGD